MNVAPPGAHERSSRHVPGKVGSEPKGEETTSIQHACDPEMVCLAAEQKERSFAQMHRKTNDMAKVASKTAKKRRYRLARDVPVYVKPRMSATSRFKRVW